MLGGLLFLSEWGWGRTEKRQGRIAGLPCICWYVDNTKVGKMTSGGLLPVQDKLKNVCLFVLFAPWAAAVMASSRECSF